MAHNVPLNSQARHSHSTFVIRGQRLFDPLWRESGRHGSIVAPHSRQVRVISPAATITSAGGATEEFRIRSQGFISDMWIETAFAAPSSGNYTQYTGQWVVDRFELRNGSNLIHEFDGKVAMEYIKAMNRHSEDFVGSLNYLSGGTSFNNGTVITPLPFPCLSSLAHGGAFNPGIPGFLLDNDLIVRLTTETVANLLDASATGGSISAMRLRYVEHDVADSLKRDYFANRQKWEHLSDDWQTNEGNSVGTSAADVDLSSFRGHITKLFWRSILGTNVSTAHDYHINNSTTAFRLQADGVTLFENNTAADARAVAAETLLMPLGVQYNATTIHPNIMSFDIDTEHDHARCYSGGLHMNDVHRLIMNLTVSAASSYADFLAARKAHYKIVNGSLVKIEV